jgi:hypothetical protein
MTLKNRFASCMDVLKSAVNGEVALDTEYPALFAQLCRFYSDMSPRHVHFWGVDVEEDYQILIDNMTTDLMYG